MPDYKQAEQKDSASPLLPLVGFIILAGGGVLSWLVAPGARLFLATHPFQLGALGAVRIEFPADWSPALANGVMALVLFIVIFALFMIVVMAIQGTSLSPEEKLARDLAVADKSRSKKKRR